MEEPIVRQLAEQFKKAGLDLEGALSLGILLHRKEAAAEMISWMEQTSCTDVNTICAKAREIAKKHLPKDPTAYRRQ